MKGRPYPDSGPVWEEIFAMEKAQVPVAFVHIIFSLYCDTNRSCGLERGMEGS